jgi:hypothetical protein
MQVRAYSATGMEDNLERKDFASIETNRVVHICLDKDLSSIAEINNACSQGKRVLPNGTTFTDLSVMRWIWKINP